MTRQATQAQEYEKTKEKIITGEQSGFIVLGEDKGYIYITEDRSGVRYRTSGKSYNFREEREKVRAYFLVKLIEKYKYPEQAIHLDVEVPGLRFSDAADLVIYKDSLPYIVVDCRGAETPKLEVIWAQETVIKKADILKAKYAALLVGPKMAVFDMSQAVKDIPDIPVNKAV